jgi:hypothetical protein
LIARPLRRILGRLEKHLRPAPEPSVRGRAMIELIAHLDELEPALRNRVLTHVSAPTISILERALATDWIRASHTREVIDGVVAELGERAPTLWASLVGARLFRSPLLRGFVDTIVRLGGLSPGRFIKAMPRGWKNAYKGWCEPRVAKLDPQRAVVEFLDVAPYLFEHRQHWIAIQGVLEGLVAAAHRNGHAELTFEPARSRITAHVDW